MRILLKILLFPVTILLTIVVLVSCFLIDYCSRLLSIIAGIIFILAVASIIIYFINKSDIHSLICGIAYMVIAWLLSPYGLPMFSAWVVDKVSNLNEALKSI